MLTQVSTSGITPVLAHVMLNPLAIQIADWVTMPVIRQSGCQQPLDTDPANPPRVRLNCDQDPDFVDGKLNYWTKQGQAGSL